MAGEDRILVMPDNVHPRYEWLIAFKKMGVRVFSESSFVQMLSGFLSLDGVMPRELTVLRSKKRSWRAACLCVGIPVKVMGKYDHGGPADRLAPVSDAPSEKADPEAGARPRRDACAGRPR